MFDLITGKATHIPHTPALPLVVSTMAQLAIGGLLVVIPVLFMADQLPQPSTMMAFVAAAPPPPPPPPPPAPLKAIAARPVPTSGTAAPIAEPSQLDPEPAFGEEEGVPGGVEGGVPGGVVTGVFGGLSTEPPPPPPPPPPPREPVRIGGQLQPPALVHRVEPVYPDLAVRANVQGMVILEALVNEQGRVESVTVLRSITLLDKAAMQAVRQWQYEPLLLNGVPTSFVLTVTLAFRLS